VSDRVPAERKRIRLHRTGGSQAAIIPRRWLERHGIGEDAVLYDTEQGIVVGPPNVPGSIEDEPEFARFLEFLARDALRRPERLVNPRSRLERARGLTRPASARPAKTTKG